MSKQNHHTVQEAYLNQWINEKTGKFSIFVIKNKEYLERTGNWAGFKKPDYNILDDPENKYYPEEFTSNIDTQGINVIRDLNFSSKRLLNKERVVLSHYLSLQYLRTPRYRNEINSMINAQFKVYEQIHPLSDIKITKEDLLKDTPKNEEEKKIFTHFETMTEKEIEDEINAIKIDSNNLTVGLSKSGQSKAMVRNTNYLAEKIFNFQWIFLISPKDTSFITSDNPCFVIPFSKFFSQGLGSDNSVTVFPVSPKICILVDNKIKSKNEIFVNLSKEKVRTINKSIILNSYESVVSTDKRHLEHLLKGYDFGNHKKSRQAKTYKDGDYIIFNLE